MNLYLILVFGSFLITTPSSAQSCSKLKSCATPSCCSEWGYCGFGPDFCGSSCVRDCDKRPECGQYSLTPECPLKVCCSQYGFCGLTNDFCTNCQSNCKVPAKETCAADSASVRVGYYASWARDRSCYPFFAENINPRIYTHLNFAFGQISGGVMVAPSGDDLSEITTFNGLKSAAENLKTLISVGGWAFNDPGPTQQEFHNIILTSASRAKFINSVQSYLETYGFDGIDIDYEYPSAPDRGGSPEDKLNFVQLVKEMRAAFGSKYLITIAAPASYWYLQNFAIGEMSKYLDFINVMTYDIHGTWDADIASLGPVVRSHTNIREVETALELFRRDGVPSKKLVLGLAYYGRSFQLADPSCTHINCTFVGPAKAGECTNSPGTLAWFEISGKIANTGAEPIYDSDSMSKILVFDTDQWVAYDDEETLLMRQNYAGENCLLGTMVWSIDQGVDQSSGITSLKRQGSFNINNVNLLVVFTAIGFNIYQTIDISADYMYVGDEVDYNSVTVSRPDVNPDTCDNVYSTPTITTATSTTTCSPPMATIVPVLDRPTPGEFFETIYEVISHTPGIYDHFQNIPIADRDPTDPTVIILMRDIASDGVFRIEYVEAFIYPRHLTSSRTSFGDEHRLHLRTRLDGQPLDEAGHWLANFAGGRATYLNLMPQHQFVNHNVGARSTLRGWLNAEIEYRNWLKAERSAGNSTSYVRWQAVGHYSNTTTGRPTYFSYRATMVMNGRYIIPSVGATGYYVCNGSPTSFACPKGVKRPRKPKKPKTQ